MNISKNIYTLHSFGFSIIILFTSFLCVHTTTSITIGWILTAIFFIISFIATKSIALLINAMLFLLNYSSETSNK